MKEDESWIDSLANLTAAKISSHRKVDHRTVEDAKRYSELSGELWEKVRSAIEHVRDQFNRKLRSHTGNSDVLVDISGSNAPPRSLSLRFETERLMSEITILIRDHDRQLVVVTSIGAAKNKERTLDIIIDGETARLRTNRDIPDDQIGRELLASWLDAITREA